MTTPADWVGWASSAVLVATLARQVYTQATRGHGHDLSRWLFAGQIAASLGFIAYSWMLGNNVFLVTNSIILATAIAGQYFYFRNERRSAAKR